MGQFDAVRDGRVRPYSGHRVRLSQTRGSGSLRN